MTSRISLRVDRDRLEELERIALREGFSVSAIVRHLVYRFLEQEQRFETRRLDHE